MKTIGRHLCAMLALLLLGGCSGGGSVGVALVGGGVGTGGTGITWGIVTGFGSIVIDGDVYSSSAEQYREGNDTEEAAVTSAFAVDLGEQLKVQTDSSGNPTSVLIEPSLIGTVSEVDAAGGTLVVNGVTVRANSSAAAGPLTYYVGLADMNAIHAGMYLEIHGLYASDAAGGYIQATCIKLLSSATKATRITGVVSNLSANSFEIGGTTIRFDHATVLPAGTALAAGQLVNVWSASAPSAGSLNADVIRVRTLAGVDGTVTLSGLVTQLSARRFSLSGITVDASAVDGATLYNGEYVVATGTRNRADGSLTASGLRPWSGQTATVGLKGAITNYLSNGDFMVRGVRVDASAAAGTAKLGDGSFVQLQGRVSGDAVVADELVQESVAYGDSVDYSGTVSGFDGTRFTLTTNSGSRYALTLGNRVGYQGGMASRLANGAKIEIEALYTESGLSVYGVSFED